MLTVSPDERGNTADGTNVPDWRRECMSEASLLHVPFGRTVECAILGCVLGSGV